MPVFPGLPEEPSTASVTSSSPSILIDLDHPHYSPDRHQSIITFPVPVWEEIRRLTEALNGFFREKLIQHGDQETPIGTP